MALRGGVWKWWEEKGKGGEEEKRVPQSYRAGASKDSKGGNEWRGEREEGGEKDPGETLNRCVKPLSAFLLGNARSGASRKTI